MPPNNSTPRSSSRKFRIVFAVLILIAAVSLYENFHLLGQINTLKNPQASAQDQVQQTLARVSKLMVLPQDETPTVATVSDLSKLKDQPFFANAAVGDQVIIFSTARRAILWRPSENKIVEVAPLTVDNSQTANANAAIQNVAPTPAISPSSSPKPKK